jgi:hypothetical protein
MRDYRQHLSQVKLRTERKMSLQREASQKSFTQMVQQHEQNMQSTILRSMREEVSFNESITALNTLEAKLKTVKEKQLKRFEEVRLSRNSVWERAEKVYTQHLVLSDKEEMRKI